MLSLFRDEAQKVWLLSGWEKIASGETGEGNDSTGPTDHGPSRALSIVGAEAKVIESSAVGVESGGRPLPHIPRNMTDVMVGKPEGLSGSQTRQKSRLSIMLGREGDDVNPVFESAWK